MEALERARWKVLTEIGVPLGMDIRKIGTVFFDPAAACDPSHPDYPPLVSREKEGPAAPSTSPGAENRKLDADS